MTKKARYTCEECKGVFLERIEGEEERQQECFDNFGIRPDQSLIPIVKVCDVCYKRLMEKINAVRN